MADPGRAAAGLPGLKEADREPFWLATAHGYGLGENDPARIEVVQA